MKLLGNNKNTITKDKNDDTFRDYRSGISSL